METIAWYRYEGCMNDSEGVGVEMERLAASMGGTHKFPYNDSECLDADFFKVICQFRIKIFIEPLNAYMVVMTNICNYR